MPVRSVVLGVLALALSCAPAQGAGWTTPQTFTSVAAPGTSSSRLLALDDGTLVATWAEQHGPFQVIAAVRPPGGSFGTPQTIGDSGPNGARVWLGADQAGNVVVAWGYDNGSGTTAVRYARMAAGQTTFSLPATTLGTNGAKPSLAMSATGPSYLVWQEAGAIRYATLASGAAAFVEKGALVTPAQTGDSAPVVTTDPTGNARVLWQHSVASVFPNGGSDALLAARISATDGAVSAPQTVDSTTYMFGSAATQYTPSAATSPVGGAVGVAFLKSASSGISVVTEIKTAFAGATASDFASAVSLDGPANYNQATGGPRLSQPALAFDDAGVGTVAYTIDSSGGAATTSSDLKVASRPVGGPLGAPVSLDAAKPVVSGLALAPLGASGMMLLRSLSAKLDYATRGAAAFGTFADVAPIASPSAAAAAPTGNDVAAQSETLVSGVRQEQWAVYDATGPSVTPTVPASATPGAEVAMSAATTDRWSTPGAISWDFGDGSPAATGAAVTHTFAGAGTWAVTVSVSDALANTTQVTRQIVVAAADGGAAGGGAGIGTGLGGYVALSTTVPVISRLTMKPARFRVAGVPTVLSGKKRPPKGTRISTTVSEPSAIELTITRLRKGARRGGRCVAGARRNKGQKACTARSAAGTLVRVLAGTTDAFAFTGKISGKPLKPGRYELRAVATDAAKNASAAKRVQFTIAA